MAIKLFFVYAGGLLACSILLFTAVKKFADGFAGTGKTPILYASLSSIIASLAAYFSTYISEKLFYVYWVLFVIFLLFGVFHVIFVHKRYFSAGPDNNTKNFLGELLFAMSIVFFSIAIFSSLEYFLKDKSFLFYPMMTSTVAFFLPVFVNHTFEAAITIPPPVFPTWLYPSQPIDLPEEDPREKLLVIGFEIAKKTTDTKRTFFRAKAPENIYLGDLYYFFINDYNEIQSETPIEFVDKNKEPFEWVFRLKTKWYQGEHVLDPAKTVKDNGIKENSVIICERV